MTDNYLNVGKRIKKIREEFNYTQKTLISSLNEYVTTLQKNNKLSIEEVTFKQSNISSIENGKGGVGRNKVLLIIDFFYQKHNVSPEYFFFKENKRLVVEDKNANKDYSKVHNKIEEIENLVKNFTTNITKEKEALLIEIEKILGK